MAKKYWFAYSTRRQDWPRGARNIFAYPVDWRGSTFLFGVIITPICLMLAAVPVLLDLAEWQLMLIIACLGSAPVVVALVVMRSRTDPVRSIEDYRAAKRGIEPD